MNSALGKFSVAVVTLFFVQTIFFQNAMAQTTPRPNVVIILVDDMKWNSLSSNNSNNHLATPNIDRIGNEGARFKYYSTNALCTPGRAALLTGKYPHKVGAINNLNPVADSVKTLPEILHDNGYYTALCGKWSVSNNDAKPFFDYWLWTPSKSSYYGDTAHYFNTEVPIPGHVTDYLTDTASYLISTMDTPFFLLLGHNATHTKWIPQTQFDHAFDTCTFNLPGNFSKYTQYYPSFLYDQAYAVINTSALEQSTLRDYYEMLAGVEQSTGRILDSLQHRGILNNTLLIFTCDNSYLIGEHKLMGKQLPFEEDMRMPLFVRYPAMFNAGTVMNNNFAPNTDITSTVLSAAKITDTFTDEHITLKQLVNGTKQRHQFMFELFPEQRDSLPQVRTFRTQLYQYNRYYCQDTTEELFNMQTDTFQLINLAKNPLYQSVLYSYRIKLDSTRTELGDTVHPALYPCYLIPGQPIITIQAGTQTFCSGGYATLLASPSGNSYQWKKNGNNINGATNNNYTATQTGNYKCAVSYNGIVNTSASIAITRYTTPTATLTPTGTVNFCSGQSVALNVNLQSGVTYQWYRNNILISGATLSSYSASYAGNYKCIVTKTNGGCIKSSVTVHLQITCRNENFSNENYFSFSPNPFTTSLTVDLKSVSDISVYDLLGRKLIEMKNASSIIHLGEKLSAGMYLLEVKTKDGEVIEKKIVKAE